MPTFLEKFLNHFFYPKIGITKKKYENWLKRILEFPIWCLDNIHVTDHAIEINGWAIPPNADPKLATFTLNDEIFDEVVYPIERKDISKVFWYVPGSRRMAFYCKMNKTVNDNTITLKFVDKKTKIPFNEKHHYYFRPSFSDRWAFPSSEHRLRVHGGEDENSFRFEGFSIFSKLQKALNELFDRDFGSYDPILDWGCGCGRVSRYFNPDNVENLWGVDIDEFNVRWCRQHLPFGRFHQVPMSPPTELSSAYFELIFGISVFTHLTEKQQFDWLAELHRIAKPGAVLLMTTHGNATVCRCLPFKEAREYQDKGFVDLGNPYSHGCFRNILHSTRYIHDHWSKYFHILKIIPGYIGNHQDLIIMKKPA